MAMVPGTHLGPYKVIALLGAGGMGEVWRARDTRLGRDVAIKILPQHGSISSEDRARFRREAKSISSLNHPNICVLHDIGTEGDTDYLVMELVEGETLARRLSRGAIPRAEVVEIGAQIASALDRAHRAGVIHRDLKPANVMLTKSGAKLMDFGLALMTTRPDRAGDPEATARLAQESGRSNEPITATGTVVGTLPYMSPEQLQGGTVDARSDLWALGCVLLEMTTGQRAFAGTTDAMTIAQIMRDSPAALAALTSVAPPEFLRLVRQCLERDPEDRWQTAGDLRRELLWLAESAGHRAEVAHDAKRRPAAGPRISPWIVSAALVVVVLATAYGLFQRSAGPDPATHDPALAVLDFQPLGPTSDSTLSESITSLVYTALVEVSPCRIVSPELLRDVRRRRLGSARGRIEADEALQVAREAGATLMLNGEVVQSTDGTTLLWRLVDVANGESIAGRRTIAPDLVTLADSVVATLASALPRSSDTRPAEYRPSVGELTSNSPDSYRHYIAGSLALEGGRSRDAVNEFETALELDSTSALAYFGLARAIYGVSSVSETKARATADLAWRLRSRLNVKDRMRLEAWRHSANYRVDDAVKAYQDILERWPDDREALEYVSSTGTAAERLPIVKRACRLYPDHAPFWFQLASNLDILDRRQEALAVARETAARFPLNPDSWSMLGDAYLRTAKPDSADQAFRHALAVDPNNLYPKACLATMPYYRGDAAAATIALDSLRLGSGLSPAESYSLIATIPGSGVCGLLAEQGRFRGAFELLDRTRSEAPDPIWERRCVMFKFFIAHQYDLPWSGEAMGEWRAWSRRSGLSAHEEWEVRAWRSMALLLADSLDAADRELADLARRTDQSKTIHRVRCVLMRADLELKRGQPRRALAQLALIRPLGIYRTAYFDEFYRHLLARAHADAGERDQAARVLRDCLTLYPGDALAHYELAKVFEAQSHRADAATEYRIFLRAWAHADPESPQIADATQRLRQLVSAR